MSSQGRHKKCKFKDCITEPCEHVRPPIGKDGYCVDYNNGKKRQGIPQESADDRAKKIIATIMAHKKCTRCGKDFKEGDNRYPYPEKQVLCKDCFNGSLSSGLSKLNKVLNEK
jgi:hypothetical protein